MSSPQSRLLIWQSSVQSSHLAERDLIDRIDDEQCLKQCLSKVSYILMCRSSKKGAAKIGGSNVTMLRRRCDGNGPRCLFLDDEAGAPQMVHRLKP